MQLKTNGTMKKTSLFSRLVLSIVYGGISATMTMAQTNPKPGYVIKNNGDTIRGNIDFRTNEKLSKLNRGDGEFDIYI